MLYVWKTINGIGRLSIQITSPAKNNEKENIVVWPCISKELLQQAQETRQGIPTKMWLDNIKDLTRLSVDDLLDLTRYRAQR